MNFVSEYRVDRQSFEHLCDNVGKTGFWRAVITASLYLIAMHELFWMGLTQFCLVIGAVFLGYQIYILHMRSKEYQKLVKSNLGNQPHMVAIMDDSGVRIRNLNNGKHFELGFDEVSGAMRSGWFVHVHNADRSAVINFDVRHMTEGDGETLAAQLRERGCQIEKLRSIRWVRRLAQAASVLYILLALVFNLALSDVSDMPNQNVPEMDVRTAAAVLEELGIDGISEEIITEVESYPYQATNAVPTLLSYVGFGEYDDETWEWTAAGNGVYAVDMEFLEIGGMYTDYLAGIEDIGGGELDLADVREEVWLGSGELGLGWKKVSFTLNGKAHTLRPFMTMDWLDLGFANKVAKLVDRADTGKQLYFLHEGDTMFYVFYRDAAWAEEFEAKIGYELRTQIR